MARAALALKVIGRFLVGMTGDAIRLVGMIEVCGQPRRRRMTQAALAFKVIGRFLVGVARHTVRLPGVIEVGGQPRLR